MPYFPSSDENEATQKPSVAFTLKRHRYGHELPQYGDLLIPAAPGPYPVVILIHGGFWRAAYGLTLMTGLAKSLAQSGIAAWNIEYRRVGDVGGGWPATFLDVANAVDALQALAPAHNLDLQRVVAVGHSAGGHLALWLTIRSRLSSSGPLTTTKHPLALTGVVSLAGVVDLELGWRLNLGQGAVEELLGGRPDEVPERYALASPANWLPLHIPQVLIHGTDDNRVLLTVSQQYAQKAARAGDPVRLIELPGADHFVVIDPASDAWAIINREIRALLSLSS